MAFLHSLFFALRKWRTVKIIKHRTFKAMNQMTDRQQTVRFGLCKVLTFFVIITIFFLADQKQNKKKCHPKICLTIVFSRTYSNVFRIYVQM